MFKKIFTLAFIGAAAALFFFSRSGADFDINQESSDIGIEKAVPEYPKRPIVRVGNHAFSVSVADSLAERSQGLSGRPSLGQDEGMFFIFDKADRYGFWMKDMRFPIDILWIRKNKIIGITENVDPATYPKLFYPPSAIETVLEISAGESAKRDIKPGDPAVISY